MIQTEDDDEECESSFVLYSLRNHHLVKRLPLSGPPSTFTANDQFIVVVSHSIRLAINLLICVFVEHGFTTYPTRSFIYKTPYSVYCTITVT